MMNRGRAVGSASREASRGDDTARREIDRFSKIVDS